jgi:predicted AAA+ superfamily ATPase
MISVEAQNRIIQINPWLVIPEKGTELVGRFLPHTYVLREMEELSLAESRALLVVGPRQSGKSTMIWHRIRDLSPQILFLNMEDPLLRTACAGTIDFVEYIRKNQSLFKVLFVDEIQHMEEAGLFVKGVIDAGLGIPFVVTGSSSFHLRSRTRESLAGRAIRRRLLPFSLGELLRHEKPPNSIARQAAAERIVSDQLVFGGYPAVFLAARDAEKKEILNNLVESLILRDASDLFRIKRIDAFRKLLTLLAGQIGNLANLSELASICNVDVGTISNHIEILEENHIVQRVLPFAGGKRAELTSATKVFFIDCGVRNQLLNNHSRELQLRTDIGPLLEDWVFSEICKNIPLVDTLKFWRSKAGAEVDFVIEHGKALHAVEVKFASLKRPLLSRSIRSFIEAYEPEKLALVNMSLEHELEFGKTLVSFVTPVTFMEWLMKFS